MAEPTCQKCGGHNFDYENIGQDSDFDEDEDDYVFIIFCQDCGWIAGCGAC